MTKKYPSERAAALFNQAIAALQRVENAPQSPIEKFHTAKERRELRRTVLQLRRGQIVPESGNPLSPDELADIYELTIRRDETVDEARRDFRRAELPLDRLAGEEGAPVAETFKMMYEEAEEGARLHGPASEDAQRLRMMQMIAALGQKFATQSRRKNESRRVFLTRRFGTNPDPETVFRISAEDSVPARGRVLFRIGIGGVSWIGNFERGDTEFNNVQLLPDGKHVLVTARGAGYVIEAQTRTLVERIGNDVVSVGDAYRGSVVFVNHGDRSVEAFGIPGRLWKTENIGCGGFRGLDVEGETFIGEARQSSEPEEWGRFSVSLRTGEVSWRT